VLALGGCGPAPADSSDGDPVSSTTAPADTGSHSTSGSASATTASAESSTSSAGGDSSTTGSVPPLDLDPPPLRWVRQYAIESPGSINALDVSGESTVTIAGAAQGAFQSVLPRDEVSFDGVGSIVVRYEDDALGWSVLDGGRSNWFLEVLEDTSVLAVGTYDNFAKSSFAEGTPQETALPPTFTDGMHVARYDSGGAFDWVLAGSGGYAEPQYASLDPFAQLHVLGVSDGDAAFEPDGMLMDAGWFHATYPVDGTAVSVQAGPFALEVSRGSFYQLFLDGPEFWPDGGSATAATFCGQITIGPDEENETVVVSDPPECSGAEGPITVDAFVVRHRSDASVDWVVTVKTPGGTGLSAPHVTPQGRLVVMGYTSEDAELLDTQGVVTEVGGEAIYIAAFESNGELAWHRELDPVARATNLETTSDGHVLVVGILSRSFVFEPGRPHEETLEGPGVFGILYDADGEPLWATILIQGEATGYNPPLLSAGDGVFGIGTTFLHDVVLAPDGPDEQLITSEIGGTLVALFEIGA
jgi:hypothetical protein